MFGWIVRNRCRRTRPEEPNDVAIANLSIVELAHERMSRG